MAEAVERREHRYIPWTPEQGFYLSFITVKQVSVATGVSCHGIRKNIVNLLKVLPVKDRVRVLESLDKRKRQTPTPTST